MSRETRAEKILEGFRLYLFISFISKSDKSIFTFVRFGIKVFNNHQ